MRAAENKDLERNCSFWDSYSLCGEENDVFTKMLAEINNRLDPEELGLSSYSAFTKVFIEQLVHARYWDTLSQRGSTRVTEELGRLSPTSSPMLILPLAA